MGVSVEQERWADVTGKDHLEGNLCFIDGWNGDFAENYKITGVPRYMVFDQLGRIVSVAAPKPTAPELKELIKKVLMGRRV